MSQSIDQRSFDVVVVGAGSAGIAAAISAASSGARTALVESGNLLGGELLTGMTIDGAISARGEQISGGILDRVIDKCEELGGFVRRLSDWRLIQYIAYDPEIMKIAVPQLVYDAGVSVFLQSFAEDVIVRDGHVGGVMLRNKSGRTLLRAKVFVDCSGDGDICVAAGAEVLPRDPDERLQPVSMMFRMAGVETAALLDFIVEHPEFFALGESEAIRRGRTDAELAEEIRRQGQPCVFLKGDAAFLGGAIARGDMYPTALIMIQPTSEARGEVCVNSTRVTLEDPLRPDDMASAMRELTRQVTTCSRFLRENLPGFARASLSGLAPKLGVRETRRIAGDHVLSTDEVKRGAKSPDGVAKGCHHIDLHEDGMGQTRIPIADGGSYDIPYGCLVPRNLGNVLMAGRCFSADRPAHGSARVMGGCMAMGQAAGLAASMACLQNSEEGDVRSVPVPELRAGLKRIGAILDGVH